MCLTSSGQLLCFKKNLTSLEVADAAFILKTDALKLDSLSEKSADVLVVRQFQRVHDQYARPADTQHLVKAEPKDSTGPGLLATHLFSTVSRRQSC